MVGPRKNGTDPITNSAATIKPHNPMVTGFTVTTRIEMSSEIKPRSRRHWRCLF